VPWTEDDDDLRELIVPRIVTYLVTKHSTPDLIVNVVSTYY
jgi:hypothetical protein